MRKNTSLRFLVITGAFLSAESVLAQNSLSTGQSLVANNTLKTQLSGINNFTKPDVVSAQVTQTDKYISTNTENSIVAVDRSLVRPVQSRFSEYKAIANNTQMNVLVSDVASLDRRHPQVSSVPNQAQPEASIEIPVPNYQAQPETSIEIPVPLPRTQIVRKVAPVASLPLVRKVAPIASLPLIKKVAPVASLPRTVKPSAIPSAIAITTLPPVKGTIPFSKPTAFIDNSTNQPSAATAPFSKPTAFINNSTNQPSTESIYPLMNPAPITSRFGWRTHPLTGTRRFHAGIDIAAPAGTPVVATGSGTVISAGWNGGYGKAIIIQHGDVQQTLYGHLSEISVQPGQEITQGMVIGLVGSTGKSTGPHLHFESRMPKADTENTWVAVDPSEEIQYAVDNLRRSMPFARKDLPQGL